jgi:uncharacterized protein
MIAMRAGRQKRSRLRWLKSLTGSGLGRCVITRVAGAYALAGHEHPVYRVATRLDSARLPCFRFGAEAGVLPAFGAFTGGFEVNASARGERIFAVAGERVMAVRTQ